MPLTFSELHNFTDSHHRKVISNDLFIWIAGLDLPSILLIVMIWKPHDSQRNLLATSRVIHFLKIGPIFQFSLWVVALVIFTPQRKGHGRFRSQQSHTGLGAASGSASLCYLHPTTQARNCTKKVIVLFAQDGPRFVSRSGHYTLTIWNNLNHKQHAKQAFGEIIFKTILAIPCGPEVRIHSQRPRFDL